MLASGLSSWSPSRSALRTMTPCCSVTRHPGRASSLPPGFLKELAPDPSLCLQNPVAWTALPLRAAGVPCPHLGPSSPPPPSPPLPTFSVGGRCPCVGQPGTILRCINKSPCLGRGWAGGRAVLSCEVTSIVPLATLVVAPRLQLALRGRQPGCFLEASHHGTGQGGAGPSGRWPPAALPEPHLTGAGSGPGPLPRDSPRD